MGTGEVGSANIISIIWIEQNRQDAFGIGKNLNTGWRQVDRPFAGSCTFPEESYLMRVFQKVTAKAAGLVALLSKQFKAKFGLNLKSYTKYSETEDTRDVIPF